MQWLTCASDKLAKQTHDNCDKHGVIYEMPLLKCLATRNTPSSTIWGYHKYWKFSHSETSWTHRLTNFWDSIQEELRGLTKKWVLIFAGFLCWMSPPPGMLINENMKHRIPHSIYLFYFLFNHSLYTVSCWCRNLFSPQKIFRVTYIFSEIKIASALDTNI